MGAVRAAVERKYHGVSIDPWATEEEVAGQAEEWGARLREARIETGRCLDGLGSSGIAELARLFDGFTEAEQHEVVCGLAHAGDDCVKRVCGDVLLASSALRRLDESALSFALAHNGWLLPHAIADHLSRSLDLKVLRNAMGVLAKTDDPSRAVMRMKELVGVVDEETKSTNMRTAVRCLGARLGVEAALELMGPLARDREGRWVYENLVAGARDPHPYLGLFRNRVPSVVTTERSVVPGDGGVTRDRSAHMEAFTHDGVAYELRVVDGADSVCVKAFRDNRPANRFMYSATLRVKEHAESDRDAVQRLRAHVVERLLQAAKADIVNGVK